MLLAVLEPADTSGHTAGFWTPTSCRTKEADVELTERQTSDGGTFIAIDGELDAASAPRLRELIVRAVETDGRRVTTIDLAGCTFIDSTGLEVIIEVGHLLDEQLEKLHIVNVRDQPKQLFELTLLAEAPFIRLDGS